MIYLKLTAKSTAAKYSNFLNCSLWTISRVYFTIHSRIFFSFLLMLFQNFSIEQCYASAGSRGSGWNSFEIGSQLLSSANTSSSPFDCFRLLDDWPPRFKADSFLTPKSSLRILIKFFVLLHWTVHLLFLNPLFVFQLFHKNRGST